MSLLSEAAWNSREIPARVQERAATKWEQSGDCWMSTYSCGRHGYAQIGWKADGSNHTVLAHRASWEHHMGPVPAGYTLDHLCKVKRCVNPAHLRILPNYENARRTNGRDWPLGQCAHGHPNSRIRVQPSGKRVCSDCKPIWQARYDAKRRRP